MPSTKMARWFNRIPVLKGGPGSGNWGHTGSPGRGGSSPTAGGGGIGEESITSATPSEIAQSHLNIAVNGTVSEVEGILSDLGYGSDFIGGLNERQKRMLASKRRPAPPEEWLKTQGDTITVYHGTSDKRLPAINERGLEAKPSTFANVGQEAGVFVVAGNNRRWAEYWANKSAEMHGGKPIVLELTIPKGTVRIDPANRNSFMYSPRNIQVSEIARMIQLGRMPTTSFSFYEEVTHPLGGPSTRVQVNDLFTSAQAEL